MDHLDGMGPLETPEAEAYEAPKSATEAAIIEIWATLLRSAGVGIHDTFLSLGGESLLASQVATRIRAQFGVDVPLRSILVGTIAQLAAEVDAGCSHAK